MKKSLIAVAVAGLFAAPAAMAEVTISGAINLGIEVVDTKDGSALTTGFFAGTPANPGLSRNFLNANYSNMNFSSTDDIGNGNKVIFNYQLVVDPSSFGNPVNRNSYLGMAGNWGAFKMGSNENVYERHMYQADPLDGALGPGGNLMILGTPGANTAFEVGQAGCLVTGCVGFYRRTDNTIWYESPNWNGFTFEVDYTLSASKFDGGPGIGTIDPTVLSAGAKWKPEGMPFYVDVAIEQHEDMFGTAKISSPTTTTGSSDDGFQVGAGFSIAGFDLHARFEQLSYETDGTTAGDLNKLERDAIWFGVKYNLPSGYIGGEIGQADDWDTTCTGLACPAPDTGATMYGIGYFHNLSKQSQLQFIYASTDNDSQGTYTQAGAQGFAGGPGSDHTVIHVGLKHTF